MKKTVSIALIIGLIAVILCFAACGGGGNVDDMSTTNGEMTSMLDEATTLMDELEEDLTSALNGENETTDEMTTGEMTTGETTEMGETTTE
ncbi:MAG: hypothetical protein IJW86_07620 [Clostridia bacterium]|nr:hypothetical protein [Clostridia bacterium]